MHEVPCAVVDPRLLGKVVAAERIESLLDGGDRLRQAMGGAAVVCVNSTATGGGVAEMLQVLLPYVRGAGIDARWLVIEADEQFFAITKRLHNHLHGVEGDGGPLGAEEHRHYKAVLQRNAAQLAAAVRPGDVVLLHGTCQSEAYRILPAMERLLQREPNSSHGCDGRGRRGVSCAAC